jgi:hypothetical protein
LGFGQCLTNRGGARLVSGHGFSHAEKVQELRGFLTPEVLFPLLKSAHLDSSDTA